MARCTSATSWSTSRPISGCASSACSVMQVHLVCADDAHGAPIMLKAEADGITPQALVAQHRGGPAAVSARLFTSASIIGTPRIHRKTSRLSQDVYTRLKAAGFVYVKPVEQFYDPVKGMFLADRYIKGECPQLPFEGPVRRCLRGLQHVNAPTDLINPYSTLTGAQPVLKTSDHYFFRLSDPRASSSCEEWLDTPGRLQPQVANKAKRMARQAQKTAQKRARVRCGRLGHLPRRALLRHSDPRRPGQVLLCLAGCAGWATSPRCKNYFDSGRARAQRVSRAPSRSFSPIPDRADPLHRQGHHLLPHAVLAGDAEVRRCALQGAGQRPRARLHHGLGEKMSKSRGTGISPLRYLTSA
jgi:methionyl-tRNA synthetase